MRSCESPAISFDDRGIDWLSQSGPDAGLDFGVDRVSDYPGVWTELVHFLSVQLRAGRRFYVGGAKSRRCFRRRPYSTVCYSLLPQP